MVAVVRAWCAEKVALHEVAACGLEMSELFVAAHAFGDHLHVERVSEQYECPDQTDVCL